MPKNLPASRFCAALDPAHQLCLLSTAFSPYSLPDDLEASLIHCITAQCAAATLTYMTAAFI